MFRCLVAEQATSREEIIIRAEEMPGRGVEAFVGKKAGRPVIGHDLRNFFCILHGILHHSQPSRIGSLCFCSVSAQSQGPSNLSELS